MKILALSPNFQGRVQVNLFRFSKTSEKQKLLSKILSTKGKEDTKIKEAIIQICKEAQQWLVVLWRKAEQINCKILQEMTQLEAR